MSISYKNLKNFEGRTNLNSLEEFWHMLQGSRWGRNYDFQDAYVSHPMKRINLLTSLYCRVEQGMQYTANLDSSMLNFLSGSLCWQYSKVLIVKETNLT